MSQAVRAKRLYHKLVPNVLYYEGTTVHRHTSSSLVKYFFVIITVCTDICPLTV